jgi:hypothetical protein
VTEGATHAHAVGHSMAHAQIALKSWAVSILQLFFRTRATYRESQQQHHIVAMTSVYKTLSGTEKDEEKTGGKRNKQRVLILVYNALRSKSRVHANKCQSSRGVTFRHRHLLQDLFSLM